MEFGSNAVEGALRPAASQSLFFKSPWYYLRDHALKQNACAT